MNTYIHTYIKIGTKNSNKIVSVVAEKTCPHWWVFRCFLKPSTVAATLRFSGRLLGAAVPKTCVSRCVDLPAGQDQQT